ncbi:glucosamine--fructose-6-phosphate aminotransferase [Penicillium freii]|uniref:SIS domain-containing protein n=1 Tax=Penicillium freii TaxID=48697 RepID=A0A101MPF3_PENFR|nr:glucosamine--fructose-6-phosphate aminotransferase [Penicillium freii]KUM64271.1 hypothetical protein ACN42_g2804 [Penicillium freii]
MVMFALALREDRSSKSQRRIDIMEGLANISKQTKEVLKHDQEIKKLCMKFKDQKSLLSLVVLPRTIEALMSGEPKHGVLALIDEALPLVMILTRDDNFSKSLNAYNQVIARNGWPIVICNTDDPEFPRDKTDRIEVPRTVDTLQGLLNVIPCSSWPIGLL